LVNYGEDDFLFCLNCPFIDRIISKLLLGKKSVKFTKFNGSQDPKMHVRKFHEEAMEYVHDIDMLEKLFSSSLNDDALKWYFNLPKRILISMKN